MPDRRDLRYTTTSQIMPDVDRLLAGHSTVGKWSLGQICDHLAQAITSSMDGYPISPAPWLVRKLVAPFMLRQVLSKGQMPEGVKVPAKVLPKTGSDAQSEAAKLRAAIERFDVHTGTLALHPFFGRLTKETWTQLHLIHAAHHLSFARPADQIV